MQFVRLQTLRDLLFKPKKHQQQIMNPPQILGINRTQDGSISIFEGGNHIMSIHKERLSKRKHHDQIAIKPIFIMTFFQNILQRSNGHCQ